MQHKIYKLTVGYQNRQRLVFELYIELHIQIQILSIQHALVIDLGSEVLLLCNQPRRLRWNLFLISLLLQSALTVL